jgi:pimeloyl-ACP methyl ester carboxylesterase
MFYVRMGLNISLQSWDYQYGYFSKQKEFSALVFDNRGVGWTDSPKGRYTTSEMAKDVLDLILHVGWDDKVHVVGISMGGMVIRLHFISFRLQFMFLSA